MIKQKYILNFLQLVYQMTLLYWQIYFYNVITDRNDHDEQKKDSGGPSSDFEEDCVNSMWCYFNS